MTGRIGHGGCIPAILLFGAGSLAWPMFASRRPSSRRTLVAPLMSLMPVFLMFDGLENIVFGAVVTLGFGAGILYVNRSLRQQKRV